MLKLKYYFAKSGHCKVSATLKTISASFLLYAADRVSVQIYLLLLVFFCIFKSPFTHFACACGYRDFCSIHTNVCILFHTSVLLLMHTKCIYLHLYLCDTYTNLIIIFLTLLMRILCVFLFSCISINSR